MDTIPSEPLFVLVKLFGKLTLAQRLKDEKVRDRDVFSKISTKYSIS